MCNRSCRSFFPIAIICDTRRSGIRNIFKFIHTPHSPTVRLDGGGMDDHHLRPGVFVFV